MKGKKESKKLQSKCPICKKTSVFDCRPFCSKRCADIDLGHWLKGDYRIPGEEEKPDEKEAEHEDD